MGKTASDVMVEQLLDWGVDTIFGIPGDGINGIMEALRTHQHRKSRANLALKARDRKGRGDARLWREGRSTQRGSCHSGEQRIIPLEWEQDLCATCAPRCGGCARSCP